jgi:hypothetical protein
MADTRVEQRVDQVKKYVEKNRGWRPESRTIGYLAAMLVALIAAAIFVPRLLPGTINNSESLIGRKGSIQVVPIGGPSPRQFVPPPPASEGYSSWAIGDNREEVIIGWYHALGGKVDKVSVQSRSAYSGRLQVEWACDVKDNTSRVAQLGFIPRHNQIWFLADGHIHEIDIKSSQILDLPFKGPEGRGEIKAPVAATCVAFSPVTGMVAYAQRNTLTLVTGLASGRGDRLLASKVVMVPGTSIDSDGAVVEGTIEGFSWLSDELLAVVMRTGKGSTARTPVYFIAVGPDTQRIELKVPAPSNGVFTSISHAPVGTDFAVMFDAFDTAISPSSPAKDSVYVYSARGVLVKKVGLPAAGWRNPIAWGP